MRAYTALVSGGTGAIGGEICRQLHAAGFRVLAVGHPAEAARQPELQARLGPEIAIRFCDLADPEACATLLAGLPAPFEAIEVLVNAAGITRDARFVKMSLGQWREVMAANLDAAFHLSQPLFTAMCARGYGRIVNISSVNGQKGQFGQANYSAAKAALHGFTMALAQEGAAQGVTVNTVSPGYIETPMTAAIKPEALAKIRAQIPLGRLGLPAEIARVVCFLCDVQSAYITGANIPVNGGLYMSA